MAKSKRRTQKEIDAFIEGKREGIAQLIGEHARELEDMRPENLLSRIKNLEDRIEELERGQNV